jgi:MFS family permease
MAQRAEIITVYSAGLIQGVALVTFPAASAVFTNPVDYGLPSTEYGAMFVPQAVMAIVSSLLGAGLRMRLGAKCLYLLGLFSNLLAMTLLIVSRFVMKDHSLAYGVLLAATTCMGIGFGFTVPALNTFAAAFFPKKVDRAVLVLNALLGLGTALAPVFVALFVGFRIWWGLPALVGVLILGLLLLSFSQTLITHETPDVANSHKDKKQVPLKILDFCHICPAIRSARNHERQLGRALRDKTFWCQRICCVLRLGHFLGHGDHRTHLVRRHRKVFPG